MMSTDKQAVDEPVADEPAADEGLGEGPREGPGEGPTEDGEACKPSWWHRDHPTFAALTGFFTGLLFVALVPATFFGILSVLFENDRAEDLFPFVLVTLVVPLALVINRRTRRFGTYFWIGIVLTAVVVLGVGALVLWYLVEHQG